MPIVFCTITGTSEVLCVQGKPVRIANHRLTPRPWYVVRTRAGNESPLPGARWRVMHSTWTQDIGTAIEHACALSLC